MKKIIPYIVSLALGIILAIIYISKENINIIDVFSNKVPATGFQLGVFTDESIASSLSNKYPSSLIIKDNDVYRVYYSILTNNKTITKMEDYLNKNKIAFYKKDIEITDNGLIKALSNYETSILEGNDDVLTNVNKLIMNSYGGTV